jgi:alanyl-tRNA synthetase
VRALAPRAAEEPMSLRVIADHIRACAFLVLDGVRPSNEGRGYVLRRIIRRALRHGHKLGIEEPFFHRLVAPLAREMGEAYPALVEREAAVAATLRQEEERFAETLGQGLRILEAAIAGLSGNIIPGATVFQLYDTYGFPFDLTADIARERALELDTAGFEAAMQEQRERARAASQFGNVDTATAISAEHLSRLGTTQTFTGYAGTRGEAKVSGIFAAGRPVDALAAGEAGVVVLDCTPFYAEAGGQVGDRGRLTSGDAVFAVEDTRRQGGLYLHHGRMQRGRLTAGAAVVAEVEEGGRQAIRRNHSATHLMHAALRTVLGAHVEQKGSLVDAERLRFDFSHPGPVSRAELRAIEARVNAEIRRNVAVEVAVMPYREAVASGAMALFGEKYGDEVRVLRMGDFSVELCGGTHVDRTGDIGLFKIVSEAGVASGVRRIEAVTGEAALAHVAESETRLERIAEKLRTGVGDIEPRLTQLVERARNLEREVQDLKGRLAGQAGRDLGAGAREVGGAQVVAEIIEGADAGTLRAACDRLKDRFERAVIVLGTVEEGKVRLIAGVTRNLTDRVHAGELVNFVAQQVGGKGGGRPDMAQAGGTAPERLDEALRSVPDWVAARTA